VVTLKQKKTLSKLIFENVLQYVLCFIRPPRPPGTVVPNGLMFYCLVSFLLSFLSLRDLPAPPPIDVKLCEACTNIASIYFVVVSTSDVSKDFH